MTEKDEKPKHPAQSGSDPKPGWPKDVRPISTDGTELLGVGDDGSIYWDGKPIEVRKTLSLSFWQRLGAVLTVLATCAIAIVAVLQLLGFGAAA